jgi:DNA-3-methyladenine glycosylase
MQGVDKRILNNSLVAAKKLLGCKLISCSSDGVTSGYIVETESYNMQDAASHSYTGKTDRNAPMFDKAGTIYVYFTYGMHYCFNIVAGKTGDGQAVLVRALEPIEGIDLMKKRRNIDETKNLTNGPAKLCQAMGINKKSNKGYIFSPKSSICLQRGFIPKNIVQTKRIGIKRSIDKKWRFYIADSMYISKK